MSWVRVLFASVILTDILRCTDIILFHFLVTAYMYFLVRQVHRHHAGRLIVHMWNKIYAKNEKLSSAKLAPAPFYFAAHRWVGLWALGDLGLAQMSRYACKFSLVESKILLRCTYICGVYTYILKCQFQQFRWPRGAVILFEFKFSALLTYS